MGTIIFLKVLMLVNLIAFGICTTSDYPPSTYTTTAFILSQMIICATYIGTVIEMKNSK